MSKQEAILILRYIIGALNRLENDKTNGNKKAAEFLKKELDFFTEKLDEVFDQQV